MSSMAAAEVDIPPPAAPPHARPQPVQQSAAAKPSTQPQENSSKDPPEAAGTSDEVDGEDIDIPSAEMIRLAKEKRQRLRGAHMAPGYVPSDNPAFQKASEFRNAEDSVKKGSDDESEDDDRDDLRLKFSGGVFKTCARKSHKDVAVHP